MRAVILAAGRGTRLNGHGSDLPKALLTIGGGTLIQRQLAALNDAGVDDVAVVVGCGAEEVRSHCGRGLTYVENARFAETNSLYSLWLARHLLTDDCVVLNSDVLFHPQLLVDLLTARHGCALLVAYREPSDPPYGDEEMQVRVRGGRVVEMGKALAGDADGENVGIVRFDAAGAAVLSDLLDGIVAGGGLREWAPRAFSAFAARHALWAIGTRGYPWIEIDFPEDYERAANAILPDIEATTGRRVRRAPADATRPHRPAIAGAAR